MQEKISLRLLPSEALNEKTVREYIASALGQNFAAVKGFNILKRSIDARGKQPLINLTLQVFINEPFHDRELMRFDFKDVTHAEKKVIIVGAGPAGLFAALQLLEAGIKPIILERG